MRLFSGKIPTIVEDAVRELTSTEAIEVESREEVILDLEAVLKEFLRRDRKIVDEAKQRMETRGLGYSHLGKMKSQVAKERGFPHYDEQLPYLVEQLMTMLFHSKNVAEVFAEDNVLRKTLTTILRKHMDVESDLDREVRSKIKNLTEGTATFEIEYAKIVEQMKRKKGLTK